MKEKETARKEYKEAVAAGHGAYLMEEEAPDVFTVSIFSFIFVACTYAGPCFSV